MNTLLVGVILMGIFGTLFSGSNEKSPLEPTTNTGVVQGIIKKPINQGTPIPGEGFLPKEIKTSSQSDPAFENIMDTDSEPTMKPLGHISAKYESGGRGAAAISPAHEYGTYQLSSKAGTLDKFLESSDYGDQFKGLQPGTKAFNDRWTDLAEDPQFGKAQRDYIRNTHFIPLRIHADRFDIPDTTAINEALYSISVQHGKSKQIINNARLSPELNERAIINRLYKARSDYVQGLKSLPKRTKESILNRFKDEQLDILALL